METYEKMKARQQAEINNLPFKAAFSKEQFEKAMTELGLTTDDTDKIYKLGDTGLFYRRTDSELIHETLERIDDELSAAMKDPEFAYGAFLHELWNHEYCYNTYQGDYDVCACFGSIEYGDFKDYCDYLKEIGFGHEIIRAFERARCEYYRQCDEKGVW